VTGWTARTLRRSVEPADMEDHSRTLALEETFFDSLNLYFQMTPVLGGHEDTKIYLCRRWPVTEEWSLPTMQDVMHGGKGVTQGRAFGLIDEMLGSMQW
jgi:hypothetical protein